VFFTGNRILSSNKVVFVRRKSFSSTKASVLKVSEVLPFYSEHRSTDILLCLKSHNLV
jgi:hypothetical protein